MAEKIENSKAVSKEASNEAEYLLTTVDNPWNPHSDFEQWYMWDCREGYYTLGMLSRLVEPLVHNLEDEEEMLLATNMVIDEILEANYDGLYAKIYEGDVTPMAK